MYKYCTFVKLAFQYLFFCLCYYKWNCFLNFIFWYSFLASRNAIDFCILISLYLVSFHVEVRDSLLSTILIWMWFMTSPRLIVLCSTCGTMVNKSDEREHPWLVSNISGKAFNFSLLNIMLAFRLFFYSCSVYLKTITSVPNFLSVSNEKTLNFVKCFFCAY